MKAQRELARLLAARDRTPSGLSGPQMQYSSLEDGSFKEYDRDGNLVSETGKQWDGSHGSFALTGPTPPRPSAPVVEGGTSATISWDGVFLNEAGERDLTIPPTMDWSRAEIHISQTKGFLAETAETLVDTIETPRGGAKPALPGPGVWFAVLVSRSLAGKRSGQSPEAQFEIIPGLNEADLQVIRDEFGDTARELNLALQDNVRQQQELGIALDTLQDTTLPAMRRDLEAADTRLDTADELLNVTFPKRMSDAEQAVAVTARAVDELASRGQQLVKNGDFELGDVGWAKGALWSINPGSARNGSKFGIRLDPSTTNVWPQADPLPTETGRVYRVEMWVRRVGGDLVTNNGIGFAARTGNTAGVFVTPVILAKLVGGTGNVRSGDIPTDSFVKVWADVTITQPDAKEVRFAPWIIKQPNSYDVDDFSAVDVTFATEALTIAGDARTKAAAAETAAAKAAADLVTAKARADAAAAAATKASQDAAAAEASSARATGAAGVAETAADRARQDAEAALAQAQGAGTNVAAAQAAATAAQTAADTAKAEATKAGTAASAADAKAAQAAADATKAAADALTAQQKATTAASEATTAKNSATTAATKATAAEAAATAAQGKANTAASDAAAAALKATAAEASATKASGSAGTAEAAADKARVDAAAALTQATNSGSNATAAQTAANAAKTASDTAKAEAAKAGTAAAAADAAAAEASAKAAQAAADLIVARNAAADARGDADTALGRADSAILAAGSAARVLYSTANPSGTAREGDTWRKTTSDVGPVMAEWRYTKNSAGASAWRPQQVTGDMVSNFDVGRLTAGSAAIISAVAEKFAAATASIQTADIKNLFVTGNSVLNDVVAERMAAKIGQFVEVKTSQLTADSANFKTGVAERFASGIGSFLRLFATQVFIGDGGNMLPDPGFRDADTNAGRMARSTGTWTLVPGTATEPAALRHTMASANDTFQYWPNTPTTSRTNEMLAVFPGQVFRLSVDVTTSAAGVCRWNAYLLKADGTVSYVGLESNASATGRRPVAQDYTIPAGVVGIAFAVACLTSTAGTFTVHGNGSVREKITPALVVDGLVSGQRIVGAQVETSADANRGIKMIDAGLFAFDSTGKETLRFDGANSIITGATLRTAPSGARWQMSTAGLEAWDAAGQRYLFGNASGLEMIGSISSKGMTGEATARPINVRLTTVTRNILGNTNVPNPALVFDDGVGVLGKAPGIYSPDGKQLIVTSKTSGVDSWGTLTLSDTATSLSAESVALGQGGIYPTKTLTADGQSIRIGNSSTIFGTNSVVLGANTDTGRVSLIAGEVALDGKVLINGTLMGAARHAEFTTSFSLQSSGNLLKLNSAYVKDTSQSVNDKFATSTTGKIWLEPGVYAIAFRADCGGAMGSTPELAIKNDTTGVEYVALGLVPNRWNGVVSDPSIFLPSAQNLSFWVKQDSGGTKTCTARVRIEKLV